MNMKRCLPICLLLFVVSVHAQLGYMPFTVSSRAQQVPLVITAMVESEELLTRTDQAKKEDMPCPDRKNTTCVLVDLGGALNPAGYIYHLKVTEVFKYPKNVKTPTDL